MDDSSALYLRVFAIFIFLVLLYVDLESIVFGNLRQIDAKSTKNRRKPKIANTLLLDKTNWNPRVQYPGPGIGHQNNNSRTFRPRAVNGSVLIGNVDFTY